MVTPIVKIKAQNIKNNIFIKRDDLLPFSFGGNKVRIAQEFFADMKEKGKDCIIGYGNSRSNLSRAIANMAYAEGVECHIVCPMEEDGDREETFNQKLVGYCDAIFHYCAKTEVSKTILAVIAECRNKGLDPYYINGDQYGKGNEAVPVRAYSRVFKQINQQSKELGIDFDYIFLPLGTGMTQAGLLVGQKQIGGCEKIIGMSIARREEIEIPILKNYLRAAEEDAKLEYVADEKIQICDKYLCGGYGKYDKDVKNLIAEIFTSNGIPLDPTYTGKAFCGMWKYLTANDITDKNVLFLHTGGTPLFFDYIRKVK